MKIIGSISEGVETVLTDRKKTPEKKWEYRAASGDDLTDMLIYGDEEIPIFWWRYDNQIFPLEILERGMDSVSCKLNTITTKEHGLDRLILRQIDIAEWYLKSEVGKLNCFRKGNSAEILLTMKNEKVAILELAATLNEKNDEQGRLTIWGKKGMASNRVVSQKDTPQSIYVFTDTGETETYNDLCLGLYGLSRMEVVKVAAIIDILVQKIDTEKIKDSYKRLKGIMEITKKSAAENKPYKLEEVCGL